MEKIVLKGVTISSGVVTAVACICLYFFPGFKETIVVEPDINIVPENKVEVQIQEQAPSEDIVVEETVTDDYMEKLNIQLPEGIHGGQVTISNNYITQTVTVRFARSVENYPDIYQVFGSSDYISSVGYYCEGDAGVLEIQLDQVCEFSYTYREDYLCIDFIDPHELYDKVIVVDAGHGGGDPGAVKKDVLEKDLNLAILLQLKDLFDEQDKIKVYYTRVDDTNTSLANRVGLVHKSKADLFVSIHNNSTATGNFSKENGTMVLYRPDDTSEFSSKRFAEICLRNVIASTGSKGQGLLNGDYVYIVRECQAPVALIEVGYLTNRTELEKLQTVEYQKLAAQGLYNAVMQAFEEGY